MLKLLQLLLILFTLSACSLNNIPLTDANQLGIPEFSIVKNVEVGGGVFYKNQPKTDSSYAVNLGTLTPCLNNVNFTTMKSVCTSMDSDYRNATNLPESIQPEVAKLDAYQNENNIDLKSIVTTEFTQQIKQLDRFKNKINKNAKGQFKVAVLKYGLDEVLTDPGLFSPILMLEATLTDANGNVLWEQTQVVEDSEVPKFKYADYYAQPENFQKAWAAAAKTVVTKLIMEMK